jgi:protein-S-isoprenylcysteine O-methyltransferase Ste14
MATLYLAALGLLAFVIGTIFFGLGLRARPSKDNAERSSRAMHFLFFAGLGAPFLVGIFYPGLTRLDGLAGLGPLPWRAPLLAAGALLLLPGLYFLGSSNRLLRALGSGANAFRLTRRVVETDMYRRTRNPMSLGYYLSTLGLSLMVSSTLLTLYVLLGIIPAHLFFLKFFEERELELRFGESYRQYRREVSFLIPRAPAGQG